MHERGVSAQPSLVVRFVVVHFDRVCSVSGECDLHGDEVMYPGATVELK